jgi:hypothetical protein
VDVPNQFLEVGLFLTGNGFVTILKKVAVPVVPVVKADYVSCQKPSHQRCQGNQAGPEEKVGMVGQKGPSITGRPSLFQELSQASEKIFSIQVAPENVPALHAPDDDMVQNPWSIKTCGSWHIVLTKLSGGSLSIELFKGVPQLFL